MLRRTALIAVCLAGGAAALVAAPPVTTVGDPLVKHCIVTLIDEAQVPGREPGVLVALDGKEGMEVKRGEVVGRIDDSEPSMARRIKSFEHEAAQAQADNDVNIKYAIAATDVAKAEYDKAQIAVSRVKGSIAEIEVERLRLAHRKSELQIEQARVDKKVAGMTAETKGAEVQNTELSIARRLIKSPLDGVIVKVYRKKGEWVAPGDAVVHIIRIDRFRVEGFLNASEWSQHEIRNRDVTVDVELARGRKLTVPGKIVFVSPVISAGGQYRVMAEIDNRQENGQWLLSSGLNATMTVLVKGAVDQVGARK